MENINDIVQNLVDNLDEDFDDESSVTFEIWTTGYDEDGRVDNSEMFIKEFANPNEAVAYAKSLTLADIVHKAAEEQNPFETDQISVEGILVEVETVAVDSDGDSIDVGTIFSKLIAIGEKEVEEPEEDSCEDAVQLTSNDYTLLEDGSLLIPCNLMQGYCEGVYVKIRFIDEDANPLITYRIVSRTTGDFEGTDAFVCEFDY